MYELFFYFWKNDKYGGHPALRASPNYRLTRAERGQNVKVKIKNNCGGENGS